MYIPQGRPLTVVNGRTSPNFSKCARVCPLQPLAASPQKLQIRLDLLPPRLSPAWLVKTPTPFSFQHLNTRPALRRKVQLKTAQRPGHVPANPSTFYPPECHLSRGSNTRVCQRWLPSQHLTTQRTRSLASTRRRMGKTITTRASREASSTKCVRVHNYASSGILTRFIL